MADEYTPTTTEVREVVMGGADRWTMTRRERGEALDRFLAAYEAEVRERIAQDIARAVGEGTASDIARGATR